VQKRTDKVLKTFLTSVMDISSADVMQALDRDQVIPVFQPIVETRNGGLVGFEVLSRWNHPLLGLVLPNDFIGLAESSGLIGQLTIQVFRKAFRSASSLPSPLTLWVNISPSQLQDLTLPSQIRRMAEEEGFPLDRLTIEITESALMEDMEKAKTIARELKAMDCKLALDDFGTGYACLSHLQHLPFDTLKIDRSFVRSLNGTRESRKIVAAIVGLAHSLCLHAVAEGIETEEQAETLMHLGCSLGQGSLYGHPQTADTIPEMIARKPVFVAVKAFPEADPSFISALESLPSLRLAQLQAIYDGAPVGLCFLDRNFRFVNINQRLAAMTGNSIDSHIGRMAEEMYPDWFPNLKPYLIRALGGEAIASIEFQGLGAKPGVGSMRNFASYQPVRDEAEDVIGVSISVANVETPALALKRIAEIHPLANGFFDSSLGANITAVSQPN